MRRVRLAAAAYPIEFQETLATYLAKLTRWVEEAARERAELLVFPEYGALEAVSVFGVEAAGALKSSTRRLQTLLPEIDAHLIALARRCGVFILGPSAPRARDGTSDAPWRNAAPVVSPGGGLAFQDKLILTPWDKDPWGLSPGASQAVLSTPLGAVGAAICYDVEFPVLVRNLAVAGAELILAPSCTDRLAGYFRVRTSCQARALENQCVVVQASTVGDAPWCPALDANVGAAGVFGPPDHGLPPDGVLALGELNQPGWTFADVDLDVMSAVRAAGATRNHDDWSYQPSAAARVTPFA